MVKNALVGPKNNKKEKNEVGMGTVSGVTHTKFQSSLREK